jgi:hypothetical protein
MISLPLVRAFAMEDVRCPIVQVMYEHRLTSRHEFIAEAAPLPMKFAERFDPSHAHGVVGRTTLVFQIIATVADCTSRWSMTRSLPCVRARTMKDMRWPVARFMYEHGLARRDLFFANGALAPMKLAEWRSAIATRLRPLHQHFIGDFAHRLINRRFHAIHGVHAFFGAMVSHVPLNVSQCRLHRIFAHGAGRNVHDILEPTESLDVGMIPGHVRCVFHQLGTVPHGIVPHEHPPLSIPQPGLLIVPENTVPITLHLVPQEFHHLGTIHAVLFGLGAPFRVYKEPCQRAGCKHLRQSLAHAGHVPVQLLLRQCANPA